jgi:uncharacterized protein (TIGR02996 family)
LLFVYFAYFVVASFEGRMTHADAFLRDILAHPDDDGPRLIFADWLEDHGQPERAEFIRVQCELAAMAADAPGRRQREAHQDWLYHQHGREWLQPVRELGLAVDGVKFHRGFVGEVWVEEQAFLAQADGLFATAPVQHLHLAGRLILDPNLGIDDNLGFLFPYRQILRSVRRLAACPHLGRLVTLDLNRCSLGSDGVQALAVSEHLGRLRVLNLAANGIGDGGVRALCTSPLLGQLTTLDLSGNQIGSGGMRLLAEALERLAAVPEGLRLRTVYLAGNPFSGAAKRLARTSLLRRVVRLK